MGKGKLSLEDQVADGEEKLSLDGQEAREGEGSFHWKTRMLIGRRGCHWMAKKLGRGRDAFSEDQDADWEEKLSLDGQEDGGGTSTRIPV